MVIGGLCTETSNNIPTLNLVFLSAGGQKCNNMFQNDSILATRVRILYYVTNCYRVDAKIVIFYIAVYTCIKEGEDTMNDIIGYNLQYIRLARGWTQSFVATLTGLSIRSISRVENGCGASKTTITKLCRLYKVEVKSLYEPTEPVKAAKVDLLPDDVVTAILQRNSLLSDLQREVLLQFTSKASKDAVMNRNDIEAVLSESLSDKKNYSLSDVITACMAINQKTIQNITNIAVA